MLTISQFQKISVIEQRNILSSRIGITIHVREWISITSLAVMRAPNNFF